MLFAGFPLAMLSQTNSSKVGVNTRTPTEVLHVEGTARVKDLPNNGATSSIYTKTDGKASNAKDQKFTAEKMVVADKNGVLGTIRGVANWFYMPSMNISTEPIGVNKEVDLHKEFKDQFQKPKKRSPNAPEKIIENLPDRKDLYYYVTDYDANVLTDVQVTEDGILKYKVLNAPSPTSYVNIVFVLK